MSFAFKPAVRDRVSLLVMIAGQSGSGKTLSALKIARGLAGGDDSKIAVIDTEAGRALHYAVAPGEAPGPARFAFQHGDLKAPFSPDAYREAIVAADAAGFEVIVVDSTSHVWEGEGGMHDMHDALLSEQVEDARRRHSGNWPFDEDKTRERLSIGAWKAPKAANKRFVSRLLQTRAHLVLCFRADERMRMEKVKDERGRERTVIIQAKDLPPEERWSPVCEKRLPYEMGLSLILAPSKPGFPIPIKLQDQHRAAVPLDRPLSEETGRQLAEWARGGAARPAGAPVADPAEPPPHDDPGGPGEPPDAGPTSDDLAEAAERLEKAAAVGTEALVRAWRATSRDVQAILKGRLDREWKPAAEGGGKNAYEAAKNGETADVYR